jgi:hypothetical protein
MKPALLTLAVILSACGAAVSHNSAVQAAIEQPISSDLAAEAGDSLVWVSLHVFGPATPDSDSRFIPPGIRRTLSAAGIHVITAGRQALASVGGAYSMLHFAQIRSEQVGAASKVGFVLASEVPSPHLLFPDVD